MRCYKYVSDPSCFESILAGVMKFTVPAELNDPSELFPKFSREEVLESLMDLRRRGHSNEEFVGLRRQHALMHALIPYYWKADLPLTVADANAMIHLPIFDNCDLIEHLFIQMLHAMSNAVAVACLSKRWDSLPMWAHYANRAQGAVVAYDSLETVFPGDETGWLNCVKDVTYSRELAGISFYPDSYGRIFFSKLRDWNYEEEVRIATELTQCERTERNGATVHSRVVPVAHISSVIFGWRMPRAQIDGLVSALNDTSSRHIETQSATIQRGAIKLCSL